MWVYPKVRQQWLEPVVWATHSLLNITRATDKGGWMQESLYSHTVGDPSSHRGRSLVTPWEIPRRTVGDSLSPRRTVGDPSSHRGRSLVAPWEIPRRTVGDPSSQCGRSFVAAWAIPRRSVGDPSSQCGRFSSQDGQSSLLFYYFKVPFNFDVVCKIIHCSPSHDSELSEYHLKP